nr:MAG: DNA methylase [Bacteriophage sp.]
MKSILDACCGGKMFYYDKNDERVLFQDIRNISTHLCDGRLFEVKPDVQADFTNMPYEDETFSMVVFDPPHLLRNVGKSKMADMYGSLNEKSNPTGYQQIKYGSLYSDWKDMLSKGFAECFRVLKTGGFLIFKWNETDIKGIGNTETHTGEANIWTYIRQAKQYTLDLFYERRREMKVIVTFSGGKE